MQMLRFSSEHQRKNIMTVPMLKVSLVSIVIAIKLLRLRISLIKKATTIYQVSIFQFLYKQQTEF